MLPEKSIKPHSTVTDLMIPTPIRLKYIPELKSSSKVLLKKKKGKVVDLKLITI